MAQRVVHFEIVVENPERASKFYNEVFGWTINKWDGGEEPYYMASTGEAGTPGIDGGFMSADHFQQKTINTIGVDSVDEFAQKVEANGGTVVAPKMEIPGVGYIAYCKDTEGVVFGIFQNLG